MVRGRVKWFSDEKGFITPEAGGEDLFGCYAAVVGEGCRTLEEGTEVEFEVVEGQWGRPPGSKSLAAKPVPERKSWRRI